MPKLTHPFTGSCLLYSKAWAASEIIRQLRRVWKLQRLGTFIGSALLVMKAYSWIGFYAIGFLVLVPIGLTHANRRVRSELKMRINNMRGIKRLLNAQVHTSQRWHESKILHRQLKLTDTPFGIKFDQYIEDQDGQHWHISSNGETLNIQPLDSSVVPILKKRWIR